MYLSVGISVGTSIQLLSNHANLVHLNQVFTLLQVIFLIDQEKTTQDGPKLYST